MPRADDNIVFLPRRPDPAPQFVATHALQTYWDALRGPVMMPRRDAFDPRGVADTLDRTFLIERIASGLARFRLGGAVLRGLAGEEVRGLPLSLLFAPSSREALSQGLERLFDEPAIQVFRINVDGMAGRLTLLPLRDTWGPTVSHAMGAVDLEDWSRTGEGEFTIDDVQSSTVTGYARMPRSAPPPRLVTRDRAVAPRSHLRLITPTK